MASFAHRRQVLLFLVAVVLPCTVLVALGVLIFRQERELRERRLADEQRLVTREIRQELSNRLDGISQNEAVRVQSDARQIQTRRYTDSAVVLVARLEDGTLILPWEQHPETDQARRFLNEEPFASNISTGERAEFVAEEALAARAAYEEALDVARHNVQQFYARLLLGRASAKLGQRRSAVRQYQAVLESSSDVTDEFGITLWSYAAAALLHAGNSHVDILNRIAGELDSARWIQPSQLYLYRGLIDSIAAKDTDAAIKDEIRQISLGVADLIRTTELANALETDLARLPISLEPANATQTTWVLWDRADWLLGVVSSAADPAAILLAARAQAIFESLEAVAASGVGIAALFETGPDSDGELLGAEFPGLRVRFTEAAPGTVGASWNLRRWFYFAVILLVVSVTLFGAYLQRRDVRRELEMAETRSRFVSSVSHELKTPLTAIRMFAETLRLRATKPETQAEYLDTIVSESERLTRLLNNVLDFTKIERGAKTYAREPHALGDIVEASARAIRYPLEQSQFSLHVEVNGRIPSVNVDRDAIEQAILNLLANAMKYSGESRDVELRLEEADGEAVIGVTDRGVGIAPEEQSRIFDRFYRAKTEENQHIPGTGLGLTLVDHIAKAHDGYVSVESQPGKGSTFAIHLPLAERET